MCVQATSHTPDCTLSPGCRIFIHGDLGFFVRLLCVPVSRKCVNECLRMNDKGDGFNHSCSSYDAF